MTGFITHLRGEKENRFDEMRMDTGNPFGGYIERGVFVLCEKGHQLADRALQFLIDGGEPVPGNIARTVPVGRGRLLVQFGCGVGPGLTLLQNLERKLRASIFNNRSTRGKSVPGIRSVRYARRSTHTPGSGVEAFFRHRSSLTPIGLL